MATIPEQWLPPEPIRADVQRLGDATLVSLDADPARARRFAREQLALIERAEREEGRRLHKGQPLHNLGVVEFSISAETARFWFLAAHIEDARTWKRRPAGGFLAARALSTIYGYREGRLRQLARRARLDPDLNPFELAGLILSEGGTARLRLPFPAPGEGDETELRSVTTDRMVFVGGSYRYGWSAIVAIGWGVRDAGLVPVVVKSYPSRPGERDRDKSFRFLDRCALAVFDVTSLGRWDQEIARIAGNPRPMLVAYGTDRLSRALDGWSMMPDTSEIPDLAELPFDSDDRLRLRVTRWLLEVAPRPAGPVVRKIVQPDGSSADWEVGRAMHGSAMDSPHGSGWRDWTTTDESPVLGSGSGAYQSPESDDSAKTADG